MPASQPVAPHDSARATSRGAGARAPGPAMPRQGFWALDAGAGAADGEPADDGAVEGFSAVVGLSAAGEADGVFVVVEAWPIRCDLVSESRRPVTLMFSAFW